MKTITIRVDEEIFQQIETRRGNISKSDFYRNILVEYLANKPAEDLNKNEYLVNISKENDAMKAELVNTGELLKLRDERIKDLQSQLGFLQLEYQKLSTRVFTPLPPARRWWEFWRN